MLITGSANVTQKNPLGLCKDNRARPLELSFQPFSCMLGRRCQELAGPLGHRRVGRADCGQWGSQSSAAGVHQ